MNIRASNIAIIDSHADTLYYEIGEDGYCYLASRINRLARVIFYIDTMKLDQSVIIFLNQPPIYAAT